MKRFRELLACCFLLLISLGAKAQSTNAAITGQISDPTKAVLPQVKVTAINNNTNVQNATQTNQSGTYLIPSLPPGEYRLQVEKTGFRTIVKPDLVLHVQDRVELNFEMALGSASETVTVSGGAPLVDTQDATVSTVVDRNFAENLPLNGRSFQTLIEMTPGVVVTPSTGYDPGQFSVNGQRTSSNYWMVDGVAANLGVPAAGFAGGAGMAGAVGSYSALGGTNSLVSVDDLQEFRIQTSTYAPEFGRTPGAQISIVTRSGTDQFHGSLFQYFRNDALDANDWFADNARVRKPPERQNDFGGTFSGPLLKSGTFFFFSYEGQRLKLPQVAETTVPCDATCKVAGNVRAAAQPVIQPYLKAFPLPNGPEDLAQPGTASLNASYSNSASLDAYSLRVDHKLKEKLMVFARYNYSPSYILTRGGNTFFAPPLSELAPARIKLQTATAGATWMISPTVSDDFRFNYSRVNTTSNAEIDSFGGAVPPSTFPFPAPYSTVNSAFGIVIFSLTNPDIGAGKSVSNLQRQLNLVDGFSLSRGTHNVKFGIDYRRLSPLTSPLAYGQDDFFLDIPSMLAAPPEMTAGYVLGSQQTAALLFHNLGAYAQDTWRANSRLTLTYGLRWDIDFTPTSTNGYRLAAVTGYSTTSLAQVALAPAGTPLYKTDYASLAPRIGAAYELSYSPKWQSVVRGGFGVFYDLASSQVGNIIVQGYPFSGFSNFFGAVPFPLNAASAQPPPIIPPNATQGILAAFDPRLSSPYTMEWNFAVEQALGNQQTLSLSYLGAKGSRLIESSQVTNPNANYGNVIVVGNTASSNYNALQAQFTRRLSRGLQALASYTWSHSLDDASSGFGNSSDAFGASSYGPSNFDIRHTFTAAVTYDVPTPRVNGFFLRSILKGWSTENIFQVRSAPPVDVFNGMFNSLHSGYNLNVRPDLVPGQPLYLSGSQCSALFLSRCPGNRGFNPAAFANPPLDANGNPLRQGDLNRNALRGFGLTQWDFALHRDFPIHESLQLQFRAEMFNVLNHPNFGPQVGDLSTPQFGTSTAMLGTSLSVGGNVPSSNVGAGAFSPLYQVGGPRSIQLALKLTF